ncbi:MAG: hypothetical protein IPJ94_19505 [Chloroflexi bacterium]|nr:hypothetical protein [Chloroflexota bacterium]
MRGIVLINGRSVGILRLQLQDKNTPHRAAKALLGINQIREKTRSKTTTKEIIERAIKDEAFSQTFVQQPGRSFEAVTN